MSSPVTGNGAEPVQKAGKVAELPADAKDKLKNEELKKKENEDPKNEVKEGPLAIATYCEGPEAHFARGVNKELENEELKGLFKLEFASDIRDYTSVYSGGYDDNTTRTVLDADATNRKVIKRKVLDATKSAAYADVDIACIIAPYANDLATELNPNPTATLCEAIVAAVKDSKVVKYLILGCRQNIPDSTRFGSPALYEPFFKNLKLIKSYRPFDGKSICTDYEHMFTAGKIQDDHFLKQTKGSFMYLCLFDVTKAPPKTFKVEDMIDSLKEENKNPTPSGSSTPLLKVLQMVNQIRKNGAAAVGSPTSDPQSAAEQSTTL